MHSTISTRQQAADSSNKFLMCNVRPNVCSRVFGLLAADLRLLIDVVALAQYGHLAGRLSHIRSVQSSADIKLRQQLTKFVAISQNLRAINCANCSPTTVDHNLH